MCVTTSSELQGRGQNQGNDRMVGDFERLDDGGHHEDSSAQKCASIILVTWLAVMSSACRVEANVGFVQLWMAG